MALGCGEYRVFITLRGGGGFVDEVPFGGLTWGRRLDETSEASADQILSQQCCGLLSELRPWKHEMRIDRDGEQVWVGPVVRVAPSGPEEYSIQARDLTAWWDRRFVHADISFLTPVDLADIFQAVSDDAMLPDNTPGLFVVTSPCGVLGTLQVLAAEHKVAGLVLRDLSNIAIDWTAVVRDVLAGGLAVPSRQLVAMGLADFLVAPIPTLDGTAQTNRWIVATSSGAGSFGTAEDTDASYEDGLLEDLATSAAVETSTTAQAAAESRVKLTKRVQSLQEATLNPGAPAAIRDLVPGSTCRLRLPELCVPIDDVYRLQSVNVEAYPVESVKVTFQPLGTVA